MKKSIIILTTLFTAIAARGEIVWEQREVRLKAAPEDKEVVATYRFKNDGSEQVKFKSFKSACGCISITSSMMEVPPGGQGELTVKFVPEHRIGTQKRPIAVQFDDEKKSRTALYLSVEIPEIIRPQPIFLRWGPEEAIAPKSVTIVADEKYPVESMTVRSKHPQWQAKVVPVENSGNYTLEILPRRAATPQAQYVEVEAKFADGQVKRTNLYVVVR
ncbi:MAG TPA: DUF1573 domain-containing protein [Chthoniobacteraceae bacterium]|nr:DUF1573 domain-containing protein [Chthoniobacteraceae bacterium]